MSIELSLKRPARRRLVKLDRKGPSADLGVRIRVILKVASGLSCNSAAREVGCAPSTAVRTVARFGREGEASLLDHRSENGARKVDDDVRVRVHAVLTGRPADHGFERPTWTLEILRTVIAQVIGVLLSITHVWRLVKRLGARWGRPRPIVACPWKARRRQRRIAALQHLAAIGADWMLPGRQRLVLTPGNNEKRYLARRLRAAEPPPRLRRRRPQGERDLPEPAAGAAQDLRSRRDDPPDPRQLHHPQEPCDPSVAGRV